MLEETTSLGFPSGPALYVRVSIGSQPAPTLSNAMEWTYKLAHSKHQPRTMCGMIAHATLGFQILSSSEGGLVLVASSSPCGMCNRSRVQS